VWAKFEALAEGARRATARLWLSVATYLQGAEPRMVANQDHQEADMSSSPAIEKFLNAIETAAIPGCDVWSADATLDATVPNWRLHASGADAIRAEYAKWFADPAQFGELRRYQVAGDGGATDVIEYTFSWTENGVPHAGHHVHLLTVRDDQIVADTVMCGGRWPASLLAEMEAADA
jgi:hypothetical protein